MFKTQPSPRAPRTLVASLIASRQETGRVFSRAPDKPREQTTDPGTGGPPGTGPDRSSHSEADWSTSQKHRTSTFLVLHCCICWTAQDHRAFEETLNMKQKRQFGEKNYARRKLQKDCHYCLQRSI